MGSKNWALHGCSCTNFIHGVVGPHVKHPKKVSEGDLVTREKTLKDSNKSKPRSREREMVIVNPSWDNAAVSAVQICLVLWESLGSLERRGPLMSWS